MLASGRSAAAVPAMPACRPAARGRTRRHTVAALGARGDGPSLLLMARLPLGRKGGRLNCVLCVRWNSIAPFWVWMAAPHGAVALWNEPLRQRWGSNWCGRPLSLCGMSPSGKGGDQKWCGLPHSAPTPPYAFRLNSHA
eukprot:355206-Chlamydomonas_euryale.AAC.3